MKRGIAKNVFLMLFAVAVALLLGKSKVMAAGAQPVENLLLDNVSSLSFTQPISICEADEIKVSTAQECFYLIKTSIPVKMSVFEEYGGGERESCFTEEESDTFSFYAYDSSTYIMQVESDSPFDMYIYQPCYYWYYSTAMEIGEYIDGSIGPNEYCAF